MIKNIFILIIFLCGYTVNLYAVEPLPSNLVGLNQSEGRAYFKRNFDASNVALMSHLTTQETPTYCGIASAVMILNTLDIPAPKDPQHPDYYYFTQENFFNDAVKQIVSPDEVRLVGATLSQLDEAIHSYGVNTQHYYANELDLNQFRELLKQALTHSDVPIVNFLRSKLHQKGDGHFSPLAAYDQNSDRFLVLEVARYKYPPFWVTTEDLWNAVHTQDGANYRGIIIVKKM